MKRISLKGVAIGNIADIVSSNIIGLLLAAYFLISSAPSGLADGSATQVLMASTLLSGLSHHFGRALLCLGWLRFGTDRQTRRRSEWGTFVSSLHRLRSIRFAQRKRGWPLRAAPRPTAGERCAWGPRWIPEFSATCPAPVIRCRLDVQVCLVLAHLVRHALNHGNVFEGPLTDRIADAGNRGCQGQVATPSRPRCRYQASNSIH